MTTATDPLSFYRRTPTERRGVRTRGHGTSQFTVQAVAHAATAGFCWLLGPGGGGYILVTRVFVMVTAADGTGFPTAPRIQLERMTFAATTAATDIASAIAEVPDFALTAKTFSSTAPTTPVAGNPIASILVAPTIATASTVIQTPTWEEMIRWEEPIRLAALEGLVLRQATAGTASDTRRLVVVVTWEEHFS